MHMHTESVGLTGLHLTGMYYNPILASAAQFGCEGHTHWSHFAVYWIGPIVASLLLSFLVSNWDAKMQRVCAPPACHQPVEGNMLFDDSEVRAKRG